MIHVGNQYIYGDCNRLSPEGPITILDEKSRKIGSLGWRTCKIKFRIVWCWSKSTNPKEVITKTRYVDSKSNYQLLRVDTICNSPLHLRKLRMALMSFEYDLVVISDYGRDT